jgi:hypothetical protein
MWTSVTNKSSKISTSKTSLLLSCARTHTHVHTHNHLHLSKLTAWHHHKQLGLYSVHTMGPKTNEKAVTDVMYWGMPTVTMHFNTLWTGDADLHFYITTVQDGWHKSAFFTHAWFPHAIHLITQYIGVFLRMVLLTDVYRNLTSLRINDLW